MKIQSILLLLVVASTCSLGKYMGVNEYGVHRFSIDLNVEPRYRFKEPMTFFKKEIIKTIKCYLSLVPDFLLDFISKAGHIIHWINPEYYEEVDGMAYALEIDTGIMMFMQYIYEFSAFCTSVVARRPDGTIIMDRN